MNFESAEKQFDLQSLQDILDKYAKKRVAVYKGPKKLDAQQRQQEYARINQEAIDELLKEKEKFAKVFQTSNGSYYFNLDSGHTFRMKFDKHGNISPQPITNNLLFIKDDTVDKLSGFIRTSDFKGMIDQEFERTDYQEGVFPLELGLNDHESLKIETNNETFKILGIISEETGQLEKKFHGDGHIGHQITKIFK